MNLDPSRKVAVFAAFVVGVWVSPLCADENAELLARNRSAFHKKLEDLRWIAYNPTTFAPGKTAKPEDIRADLQTLIDHGFKSGETGICTYSASPDSGHDAIPQIAKDLGFSGVILGVWTIDDAGENKAARELAKQQLVDAVCCGNEGYEVRYSWEELRDAMRAMRSDTLLPVSTSEQVEDYGDPNLVAPGENDWLYPNIHPIYRNHTNVRTAASFVHSITNKLAHRSSLPILIHETGWVSRGLGHHTPKLQLEFWRAVHASESKHNICLFEAFDQDWKVEKYRGVDIGASWGLFTSDRQPKPVVEYLTGYRASQDEIGK